MLAPAMHPAQRRRMSEGLPPPGDDHPVRLRPLDGGDAAALIATYVEAAFVDALLADLGGGEATAAVRRRSGLRREALVLTLDQPIHRRFHLFVAEAVCAAPGSPRLDPGRIDSMGLVVRRVAATGAQAWIKGSAGPVGWTAAVDEDRDPDPARRPLPAGAGPLATLIATRRGLGSNEEVLPLFPVPPDVGAAIGRTVVWGVIPVSSAETTPATAPDYAGMDPAEAGEFARHFSAYLKARPRLAMPQAGSVLAASSEPIDVDAGQAEPESLKSVLLLLHQLAVELGAFTPSPQADGLKAELNAIALPMVDAAGNGIAAMGAFDFAQAATPILLERAANPGQLCMPLEWPEVDAARGERLIAAATACLVARAAAVAPAAPKFDGDQTRYVARGFVRVRPGDGCPPRLTWSPYTEAFRILPWWAGDGPATRIGLPDLGDKALLRSLKPGVAFELPPMLAKMLNGDPKKLRDGDNSSSSGIELGWLCSFSIPIITICAFIVLNIFLKLFDLIFQWMLFLKICIPIPKKKTP